MHGNALSARNQSHQSHPVKLPGSFDSAAASPHEATTPLRMTLSSRITTTRYNCRHPFSLAKDAHGGHSAMSLDFSGKRVAVLGAGKMGGILLKALLEKGLLSPKSTFATVQHEERARALAEKLGVMVGTDNLAAVRNADIIFVCVKPQVVQEVMEQVRPNVSSKQLIISVAASVPTSHIEKALGSEVAVIRAMPNTPCAIGCGMTALCKGKFAD